MDIVHKDLRHGIVKLRVTDSDDLWYLSTIIEPGDLLSGITTRKIKIGDSENAKVVKKTITLTIEAESIDFSADGHSLRINGKVKQSPEEVPKDSYHALSLESGEEFTLEKPQWLEYQKQKLQEAAEKKYSLLICLLDREEAIIALTKKSGYELLTKIKGDVPQKGNLTEAKTDFYLELIKILEAYQTRYSPEKIIVASPAFYKEEIFRRITSPSLKQKVVLATCSDVAETSFDEVIQRPELQATLKESRLRQEKVLVEELMAEIKKNHLGIYGWEEVQKAANAGVANKILLTDTFIQQRKLQKTFAEVNEVMKRVDHLKGEIHILSAEQEPGKKINGLGGIAAILRYKTWS